MNITGTRKSKEFHARVHSDLNHFAVEIEGVKGHSLSIMN